MDCIEFIDELLSAQSADDKAPLACSRASAGTASTPDVLGQEVCAHDKVRRKINKYALTVFDVASLFKATEPLATKESKEVAKALSRIYRRGPLK